MFRKLTISVINRNLISTFVRHKHGVTCCGHKNVTLTDQVQKFTTIMQPQQQRRSYSNGENENEIDGDDIEAGMTQDQMTADITNTSIESTQILEGLGQNIMGNLRRPKGKDKHTRDRDRRIPHSWQTSVRYMESDAYKKAYGDLKVWQNYRRNMKGPFFNPPIVTRITCVGEDGYIKSGSPCPICRDEYLVLHPRNPKLLMQFIEPGTARVSRQILIELLLISHVLDLSMS